MIFILVEKPDRVVTFSDEDGTHLVTFADRAKAAKHRAYLAQCFRQPEAAWDIVETTPAMLRRIGIESVAHCADELGPQTMTVDELPD
jgi:hypothetical protein